MNTEVTTTKLGRACSSDARETKAIFHLGWKAGWKETVGKTETILGGQY